MPKFTVEFYERNCVSVELDAIDKEDAIRQVKEMLKEGLDYDSPDVQVDYSDTQDIFNAYLN